MKAPLFLLIGLMCLPGFGCGSRHATAKVPGINHEAQYELQPECVKEIKINRAHFHCWVADPETAQGIICENGSLTFVAKPGSIAKTCFILHVSHHN